MIMKKSTILLSLDWSTSSSQTFDICNYSNYVKYEEHFIVIMKATNIKIYYLGKLLSVKCNFLRKMS